MKRRFFLLISSLFLVFVSCKGVLQEPTLMGENKTVTVKGTLTLPNEFNEAKNLTRVATPRTALPSIPSIATYTISATDGTSSINGTVDTSANPLTYEIALTEGSWTLTASGKDASSNVILSGTASVTILSGTTSPTPITLSMNKTSGTGSINLSVKASATKITKATVKFTAKSGGAAPSDVTLSFSSSSREQAISVASVAVGSYEIAISFFDANNALLYFCTDAVNVFENLETSTWKDSGEFVDSSGNFDVTESLVTKFARSTFYVASNTATPAGNDTTGNGSYFAPFASMQKALSAVRVANDGTSEYKIFVSGEITGNNAKVSLTATNVTSALNLTITSASNTKATLDATGVNIGVISIESANANVTLEKLIIKNGNAEKGAGIYAKDCTLAVTNCEVNTNTATAMLGGGGIYIDSTANATLEDTTIQDNSASSGYAGGLHIATSGTVTLTSCTIQGNTAQNGGGIYARSGSTVTITGGEIKNNTVTTSQIASGLGGGICVVNSTFSITGTSITGNTATNTATGEKSQGGGITIGNNTLKTTITGCTIQGNSADTGGGLYLGVASDVTLDGCTITQNTGGVDISNSVAILNNCAIQNNTQNGGVYVFAGENGGVGQTYNVTLDACTISGNKNSHNATSGVCIEHYGQGSGTFNVKGATIIGSGTEDSNIYWEDSQFRINIPESLADEAYIKLSPGYSGVAINDEILTGAAGAITTDVCEKFHVTAPSNLVIAPNSDGTKGVLKSSVINIDRTQLATVKNAPTKTEYEVGTDKADVDLTGLVVTLALQGGGSVDLSYADHPTCFEVEDFVDINKSNSSNTVTADSKYLDIAISWANTITINGKKYANGDMIICNSVEITTKTPITDYYVSSTGSDTNNGTSSTTPFASMNQAIATILQANNGSSIYTIHVKGEITGDNAKVSLTDTNVTRALKLTIQGTNKDNDKLNRNLTSSAPDGMVMHLNCSSLTLTIKNLTITGGNKDLMGGGLFIESGDITINNCEISRNTSPTGSGMSITNDATVTLTGTTTIKGNSGTTGLGVSLSQTATLKVQDGVTIAGGMTNNDLYLQNGAFVTVLGELNSSASINITLETPTSGTVVVKGGLGHAPTSNDIDRIHVLNATSGMSLYLSLGMGVLGTPPQNVSVNDLSTLQMQPGGSYSVSGNISDSDLTTLFSKLDTVQGDAVVLDLSGCTSSTTPLVISGNNLRGNIKEITFPNVEIEIQGNAFQGNQTIEKVTIPSATSIPTGSFSACPNLSQVNLGNITGPIGDNCFSQCTSLQSIEIPSGVTSLGAQAFSGCTSLQTVQIDGNTVTSISDGCFAQCTSLSSITVPEGVTSLGTNAFQGCTSLTEVHLPDSMAVANAIGEQAFSGCQHQCDIYVPFTDVTVLQATWGIQWFDMANGNYTLHTKTP